MVQLNRKRKKQEDKPNEMHMIVIKCSEKYDVEKYFNMKTKLPKWELNLTFWRARSRLYKLRRSSPSERR